MAMFPLLEARGDTDIATGAANCMELPTLPSLAS